MKRMIKQLLLCAVTVLALVQCTGKDYSYTTVPNEPLNERI